MSPLCSVERGKRQRKVNLSYIRSANTSTEQPGIRSGSANKPTGQISTAQKPLGISVLEAVGHSETAELAGQAPTAGDSALSTSSRFRPDKPAFPAWSPAQD
jgi:hypothetical protein